MKGNTGHAEPGRAIGRAAGEQPTPFVGFSSWRHQDRWAVLNVTLLECEL